MATNFAPIFPSLKHGFFVAINTKTKLHFMLSKIAYLHLPRLCLNAQNRAKSLPNLCQNYAT